MKQTFKILSIFTAIAGLFMFSTCRIGLGTVVDTQSPELAISYPPESAIIRNSFILAGTCSDDIGVKVVNVWITNTELKQSYGPYEAEIVDNGWSITLNNSGKYNGFEYCDGPYVVEVQAKDKAGRKSSKASLSFDIDNTAPVLYLSKPLSKGSDSTITTFGKQVKVAGEINENHTTSALLVRFVEFDKALQQFSEEKSISINDTIEISADTPLMLARYYTESDCNGDDKKTALRTNYLKLYPNADTEAEPEDKIIYCTFELEDNALTYQDPSDSGTGNGNKSTRYFINGYEFANTLVSDSTFGLTAENMKKLINGTSSYTAAQVNQIKEIISNHKEYYVESSSLDELASKFLLNPNNNPTFKVEGFAISDAETRKTLNSDSSFTVTINSGKDSTLLKTKSISISVESVEKDPVTNKPIFTKTYVCSSDVEDIPAGAEKWEDADDTTLRKTIKIGKSDGLVSGSAYKIVVDGTDRDGNAIYAANGDAKGYGFILSSLALPPSVTIDDESLIGKYYSLEDIKTNGITIPFTVATDSVSFIDATMDQNYENAIRIQANQANSGITVVRNNLSDVTTGLVSKNGNSTYPANLKVVKPTTSTTNGSKYSMELKVGGDGNSVDFNGEKGIFKYSFYILALDVNNKTGSAYFTFSIDNEAPEVISESISISKDTVKVLEKTGDTTNKWLNGTAYINAKLHDNYELEETRYWLYAHSSAGDVLVSDNTDGIPLGSTEEVSIEVDTTKPEFAPVNNNGTYEYKQLKLKLLVKDSVGNEKLHETTFGNTFIDQETDKPVVEPGNFAFNIEKADINSETNVFGTGSKLIGKISDDDGIAEGTVLVISKINDEEFTPVTVPLHASESFNVELPSDYGYYSVEIVVKDTTYDGASETVKAYRTSSYSTMIAIDTDAPVFDEVAINTEDTQYKIGGIVEFLFNLTDELGFPASDYLTVAVSKNGTEVPELAASITAKEGDYYKYEFDLDAVEEADYDFEFVAIDLAGKTSTITRCICKDETGPVFGNTDETKPRIVTEPSAVQSGAVEISWYNTQTLQIKGTAKDNASGVNQVQYKLARDANDKWKTLSGTTSFEEVITGVKNGDVIQIQAKDVAGNTSDLYSLPVIHLDNIVPGITSSITEDILINGEKNLTVSGTVKDNLDENNIYGCSGVKVINIKCGNNDFSNPDLVISNFTAIDETNNSWTGTIPAATLKTAFETAGAGKIYAQVIDNAGNKFETAIVNLKYDAQYPEAKTASVTYKGTETAVGEANKEIVIKGTAKDNQILKSVKLQYVELTVANPTAEWKDNANWQDYGEPLTSDLFSWSFTVNTEDSCFEDGKTYLFCPVAEDDAGNIGNSGKATSEDAYDENNAKTIKINQKSDFPVVKVSNLTFSNSKSIRTMNAEPDNHAHLYNSNKVYLSVTDDDGVEKVEYKSGYGWVNSTVTYYTQSEVPVVGDKLFTDSGCLTKAKNAAGSELIVSAYNSVSKTITADSKTYTSNEADVWTEITGDSFVIPVDGPHIIMFRVKDKAGRTFLSSNIDSNVILQDIEGNSISDTDTRVYIDVDNAGPTINESNIQYASAIGSAYGEWNQDSSKIKFGGIHNKFKLSVTVRDPNGVDNVALTYNDVLVDFAQCADTEYTDGADHVWIIEDIDASSMETGRVQYVVEVTDKTGNTSESNIIIDIDNTPALLGIESHKSGEQISTAFILKGYLTDSDNETTINYYIDASSAIPNDKDWSGTDTLIHAGGIFRMNVDGKTSADDGETHTVSHKQLFVNAYGEDKDIELKDGFVVYKNTNDKYLNVLPLYFHFLVTDKCGNTSYYTHELKIDPQGDIPTVEITYPVYPKAGTADTMDLFSGKIRAQGKATAKGNNSIVGVYMQIDPSVDGTNPVFDASLWTGSSLAGVKNSVLCPDGTTKLSDKLPSANPIENIYDRYNAQASTPKTSNMYAVYIGNTAAWNFILNASGELEAASGKNNVGIRMYVVDTAGNISVTNSSNDVFITLDSNAPQIGSDIPLYVYQYKWTDASGNAYYTKSATPTAGSTLYTDSGCRTAASGITYSAATYTSDFVSMEYKDGMSLKGEWWLNGSAMDGTGIESLKVTTPGSNIEDSAGYDLLDTNANHSTKTELKIYEDPLDETSTVLRKGYEFNYRIGSLAETAASIRYEIIAGDGQETSTYPVVIYYDNLPPRLMDKSDENFNISADVYNSYGFYTFGSTSYEGTSESGFSRVVVYFERDASKIYDTYLKKSAKIGGVEKTNELLTSNLHKEDYINFLEGTIDSNGINGKTVKVTISDDRFIHKGGLVKLGGAYYVITEYNSTSKVVTLDGNPSSTLAGSSIYFAIGNVIDTVGAETAGDNVSRNEASDGYGYYTDSIDNTDDWMIESTTTSNGATRWTASINSNNIPDGPIVIHYVVFDKAGNCAHDSIDTAEVKNNNPRLASLKVWCDFDENGTEAADGSESKTYYYKGKKRYAVGTKAEFEAATAVTEKLVVSGNEKDSANGGSAFMVVKNAVKFIPEIIGGNGDLYYEYEWVNGEKTVSAYSNTIMGKGNDSNVDVIADQYEYLKADYYGDSFIEGYTTYGEENTPFNIAAVSTDDLEALGNSSAIAPAWFNYSIYDSTAGCEDWPLKTGRHKSTFSVALNIQYSDNAAPQVSVAPFFYNSVTDNSIYGSSSAKDYRDLKGHIELEADLTNDIKTKTVTTAAYTTATALGADPKVSGMITIRGTAYDDIALSQLSVQFSTHSGISSSTLAATYSNGSWTSQSIDNVTNMSTNGWTFSVTDRYNNEDGHMVDWECNIDTSKITNKAELDRVFTIVAKDVRGVAAGAAAGTPKGLTASDTYQMDVVPYIQKVTTALSAGDTANPTKVSRTALGHYPIYQVTAGFTSGTASWTKESVKFEGFNFDYDAEKTYAEKTPDETAAYEGITKNGIPCLNNINKNNATNGSNMQPNGLNNDILTDDVFFDVWQFNSKAALPNGNKADNLVMKINPTNGMIGMAFSSGTECFSMPDSSNNSYQVWSQSWDYLKWNALTYDTAGNSFGTCVGGDINNEENYADCFDFFVGKWGTAISKGHGKDSQRYYFNLGSIGQTGTKSNQNDTTKYKSKNRYQSQSFATLRTKNASDVAVTNLYLAYYDSTNKEIRFHAGQYDDNEDMTGFGLFQDYGDTLGKYSDHSSDAQIIVDGTANSICDNDNKVISAGPYVSIGVTSDNTVVLVWYDGSDLYYTYSSTTDIAKMVATTGVSNKYWNSATKIMSGAGKYCKLVVDNENGIHIAAYDEKNTSLRYAYLSSPSATAAIKYSVVDSYLDVGEQLTIDVAQVDTKQVPYIGYWGGFNNKPRYAYMADTTAFYESTNGLDGATNDKYTGVWECTIIPAPNTANKNLINVGVWKHNGTASDDGKLAYSTSDGLTVDATGSNNKYTSSTAAASSGTCYGNGTKNAVLAFSYDAGGSTRWIETAQIK